jgi:hypothetical protein
MGHNNHIKSARFKAGDYTFFTDHNMTKLPVKITKVIKGATAYKYRIIYCDSKGAQRLISAYTWTEDELGESITPEAFNLLCL